MGAIKGTPCEEVVTACRPVHVPENVIELFPQDPDLKPFGAVSYLGVPLVGPEGKVIGNLAVIDSRPMPEDARALAIIEIFAARAAAEVSRLRVEDALRSREEQLHGLVDSAHDAIVQLDAQLNIVRANPATEKAFGVPIGRLRGKNFTGFLSSDSVSKLQRYLDALPGSVPSLLRLPSGCHFRDRCARVVDECARIDPQLEARGAGRTVACIRA